MADKEDSLPTPSKNIWLWLLVLALLFHSFKDNSRFHYLAERVGQLEQEVKVLKEN